MTQTIYLPGDRIELIGGHPGMDFGDFMTVSELIYQFVGEEAADELTAIAVTQEGRVYYHYTFGDGGFSCDLLESVGRGYVETFERLMDEHELDVTTAELTTDIYDVALSATTVLPHGAELYRTGRFA